jgi:hypothetical protein
LLDGAVHRLGDVFGGGAVAVLEVAVDRQAGDSAEQVGVGEVFVAGDGVPPVDAAQRCGQGGRRGADGLETGVGQQQR